MSGLPTGWSASTFADVADVQLGKMLDKTKNKGTPTAYLRNINIRWGAFDLSDVFEMRMTANDRQAFTIRDGDVMVCEGGEPGRAAVWRNGANEIGFQKALMRVRPARGIEPDFLALYLRHFADAGGLEDHLTGTTIKHLPQNALRALPLPIPPSAEQRRIVAKLDALTARTAQARADLDRIPALAARYKQVVLAAAFRGELTANWRSTSSVITAQLWTTVRIGDLTTEVRYGTAVKCNYAPKATPVLRIPNVAGGKIDTTDMKFASFEIEDLKRLALQLGDVLVIRSNGSLGLVGRSAIVDENAVGYLYAGYLIRLRFDLTRVDPCFIQHALQEPTLRETIEGLAKSTSGVNNINSEQLRGLSVPLPALDEQREVVARLETAFAEIDRLAAEAAAARRLLDRLDQAILAKAFRGELAPQDPADEPASALLERIKAERSAAPKARRGRKPRVA